jgi:hypothetical protein
MSKFASKSFNSSVKQNTTETKGDYKEVDWKAYNEYIASTVQETIECEEGNPSAVIGIISGIVDYGKHQDPERVEPMQEGDDKTQAWKEKMVSLGKATNQDGMFHYQEAPYQEVGFFVDFPSITIDKGQFFGESNPAPYRVLLGGVFKGNPAQPNKIKGYPNDKGVWVFSDKSRATKLAKAAKLKDLKDGFPQERLLELIGQAVTFTVEVFINSSGFLQEKVSSPSAVMKGMPVPEIDEDLLFYVGLNEDNEETYLKYLTKPVKEYIKSATDYEGSLLQKQLEPNEGTEGNTTAKQDPEPKGAPVVQKKENTPDPEQSTTTQNEPQGLDFDDDIPFAPVGLEYSNVFIHCI